MLNRSNTYLGGLGARMAIARNEIGLSQARMAEALGMSQRAYQSYETGKRSIPVEALVDMHRHFGVDLNWILLGVEAVRPQGMVIIDDRLARRRSGERGGRDRRSGQGIQQ